MGVGILFLLISIEILTICFGFMTYCYSFYYKNLYYKTNTYKLSSIWPLFLIIILFFILMIIGFVMGYTTDTEFFSHNIYFPYLCMVIVLTACILVYLILTWRKQAVNTKHFIKDFFEEDFDGQYNQIINNKNFTKGGESNNMIEDYKLLINQINNHSKFDVLILELIKFDEKYTPKFSSKLVLRQKALFLDLCIKIRNSAISNK